MTWSPLFSIGAQLFYLATSHDNISVNHSEKILTKYKKFGSVKVKLGSKQAPKGVLDSN